MAVSYHVKAVIAQYQRGVTTGQAHVFRVKRNLLFCNRHIVH